MTRHPTMLLLVTSAVGLVLALGVATEAQAAAGPGVLPGRAGFPVTGFQITIAIIVAVVLIGGGILLRRLSRSKKH